jgi:hypothetical protein
MACFKLETTAANCDSLRSSFDVLVTTLRNPACAGIFVSPVRDDMVRMYFLLPADQAVTAFVASIGAEPFGRPRAASHAAMTAWLL